MERARAVSEKQLVRRTELEKEKREEIIQDMEKQEDKKLKRQLSRGTISRIQFKEKKQESTNNFKLLRDSSIELVSNSDIKYGMDREIHAKRKESYDEKKEEQAMDWIESVTKIHIDDFHEDLKSGIVLCALLNALYPNVIQKVGEKDIPLVHRVCFEFEFNFFIYFV